jgi:branched-chain amino acid aminotransferase
MAATIETVRANRQRSAYIRPLVFRGAADSLGLDGRKGPVQAILASVPWGAYLGEEALHQGVDVQVSSWRRNGSSAASALAKIGGQYINSQSIVMEAHDNGFTEGIALDGSGHISEGSAENIFLVVKNEILTPPVSSSILAGITRGCRSRSPGTSATPSASRPCRARCCTSPTRSSSPAPRPRSARCARWTGSPSARAAAAR